MTDTLAPAPASPGSRPIAVELVRRRRRPAVRRAVFIAALAIALCIGLVPAASADRGDSHGRGRGRHVGSSSGDPIAVVNLSPFPVTLSFASADGGWGGGSSPNEQVVSSGYSSTWSVPDGWSSDGVSTVQFSFTDGSNATQLVTVATPFEDDFPCKVTGPNAAKWTCDGYVFASTPTFTLHASASSMTVSKASKNAFAQALANLCNGATSANGQAKCSFQPTSTTPTYAEGGQSTGFVPTGAVDYPGCYTTGDARDSYTYTGGGSTTQTTSVDRSVSETVSIGILDVADVGISTTTTWGSSFTRGTEYLNSFGISANYGYIATPFWYPTIATATGDFAATLGGTTYQLKQVTISTAGVPGTTATGEHLGTATPTVTQALMTRSSWAQNCPGIPAPSFLKVGGRRHHH